MAGEVEMTPVDAMEPPKVNPLASPSLSEAKTIKASPAVHSPTADGAAALRPGLKLPPKPGGLKLPPKPGATVAALKPGLRLPPKPGATVAALKPGLKLPPKPGATAVSRPQIHKPVLSGASAPLPKPVVPVDAQGVGKLPTVEAKSIDRVEATLASVEVPKPMEALKSVTQKLKGLTQEIPQQAILRKTGIISDAAQTEAQKEAAKHKTARISLSDAMGVAPVKNSPAPMKTIRIKRPVGVPGAVPSEAGGHETAKDASGGATAAPAADAAPSLTQRKTLKISRPGSPIRPTGKSGIKRPSPAAAAKASAEPAATDGEVADIPDIPAAPTAPVPHPAVEAQAGVGTTIAVLVKLAATIAMGALVWFFYENAQLPTYCGGLGWGQ